MKLKFATLALSAVLGLSAVSTALAAPPPPSPGNGGGASGQCTGPAGERPGGACQSGNK